MSAIGNNTSTSTSAYDQINKNVFAKDNVTRKTNRIARAALGISLVVAAGALILAVPVVLKASLIVAGVATIALLASRVLGGSPRATRSSSAQTNAPTTETYPLRTILSRQSQASRRNFISSFEDQAIANLCHLERFRIENRLSQQELEDLRQLASKSISKNPSIRISVDNILYAERLNERAEALCNEFKRSNDISQYPSEAETARVISQRVTAASRD